MLRFSEANAKTKSLYDVPELRKYLDRGRKVYSLDLLSGWTCPAAKDCFARVFVENGSRRLEDGPHTVFRCFSASQEVAYPNVYNLRQSNTDAIRDVRGRNQIAELILRSLPPKAGIVRFHVAGDFFKREYLEGAIIAATMRPNVLFYTYTKMLALLTEIEMDDPRHGVIKPNFLVTASVGGKYDHLIKQLGIRTATVIFAEDEANDLPIDHNDSHAATMGGSFALLLHGVQPAGSDASKARQLLNGKGTYNRKNN